MLPLGSFLLRRVGWLGVISWLLLATACQSAASFAPAKPTPTPLPRLGSAIIYTGLDYNVYAVGDGIRGVQSLTSGGLRYTWPAMSPAGGQVALSAFTDTSPFTPAGIYLTSLGSPLKEKLRSIYADPTEAGVALNPAIPHELQWSPDGQSLAFLAWEPAGQALYVASAVPTGRDWQPRRVAAGQSIALAWSPDSRSLLVQQNGELGRVDIPSLNRTALTTGAVAQSAPAWSPDGSRIAFVFRGRGSSNVLFTAQPDGSGRQTMATMRGVAHFLWSPQGDKIALGQSPETTDGLMQSLHIVDVASGEATTLASGPVVAFFWSPDGSKLAYVTASSDGAALLWRVITIATGQSADLSAFAPTGEELALLAAFDRYAAAYNPWSPDGSRLLFAGVLASADSPEGEASPSQNPGRASPRIYVADAQGTTPPIAVASGRLAVWGTR